MLCTFWILNGARKLVVLQWFFYFFFIIFFYTVYKISTRRSAQFKYIWSIQNEIGTRRQPVFVDGVQAKCWFNCCSLGTLRSLMLSECMVFVHAWAVRAYTRYTKYKWISRDSYLKWITRICCPPKECVSRVATIICINITLYI